MVSLLDMLKEADLRTGFTEAFASSGDRETLDRATLRRRLLLCLYGMGTNTGLRRVAAGQESQLQRASARAPSVSAHRDGLREAIGKVVNATLHARDRSIWGDGTTACAADGKKFGAWDQNLMTEWHVRYGGRGGHDLLARREEVGVHLLATQALLIVRGGVDDRGAAAAPTCRSRKPMSTAPGRARWPSRSAIFLASICCRA